MTPMTPRERLITAIQHKEVDYVPCSPWDNAQFPSKVQRIPLEIFDGALGIRDYTWFWKQQLEIGKQFRFDNVIISPNCIGGGEFVPYINHSKSKVTIETIERPEGRGNVKIKLETPSGVLTEERGFVKDTSDYCI